MARTIALIVALAGALLWAILSIVPPAPQGMDAAPADFSAARAFADIQAIGRAPHPVGSAENARVAAYLAQRLHELGADVSEQSTPLVAKTLKRLGRWSGRTERGVVARNVIGLIPGRDHTRPALLVMAHLDSVWGSPGAADDAIGVAVALEVARALRVRGTPERDLILLFTDCEEISLDGSTAFFERHPLAAHVGVIINLEARGAGGRANMFETGPRNGAMMRVYADRVARPATNSLAVLIYEYMPNYTDYTVAKAKGIPGFNFAILDRGYAYHSPMATPAAVDPASVQDMGDQALSIADALAFAPDLPPKTANASFADAMGRITIAYPASGGWAILLVAAGLIGSAFWRTRPAPSALGGGAIVTLALLLHGALLLTVFNAVSGSGGANYYDRLAALPRLETMAGLIVAALLLALPLFRRTELRLLALAPAMALMWAGLLAGGPLTLLVAVALAAMAAAWFLPANAEGRAAGALLLLLLVSTIVQALQPTAAPILHWPLLLAATAMAARAWLPPRAGLTVSAASAVVGGGLSLALAHFIFLGVGAELPAGLILPLFAALPLLLPLWPDRLPRWIPGGLLGVALLLALWVRLDPVAPSIPAYSLAEGGKKTKD